MTMQWLMTRGCGFVGASLIRKLGLDGWETFQLHDTLSVGWREDLVDVAAYVKGFFLAKSQHKPDSKRKMKEFL